MAHTKEAKRLYYLAHREEFFVKKREYYQANKDKWKSTPESLTRRRARRAANAEHYRAQSREYYRNDPLAKEKVRAAGRRRRTAKKDEINAKRRKHYSKNRGAILQHMRERYAADPTRKKERNKRWQKNNLEGFRARTRRWYYKDPDHARKLSREEYRRNLSARRDSLQRSHLKRKMNGKLKAWHDKNRERLNAASLARYHNDPKVKEYRKSLKLRKRDPMVAKWRRIGGLCYICGLLVGQGEFSIDHVIAKTKGGTNDIDNLMPVHLVCNVKKGNRKNTRIERPDLLEMV